MMLTLMHQKILEQYIACTLLCRTFWLCHQNLLGLDNQLGDHKTGPFLAQILN